MRRLGALAVGALLASCATPGGPTATPITEGYLSDSRIDALADALSPPGDAAWAAEAAALAGAPATPSNYDRWQLAIVHAELRPPEAAQHFDCVLGARFMAEPRPALTRLLARLSVDAQKVSLKLGQRTPRDRPGIAEPGLKPCQRTNDEMRRSPSWPASGAVVATAYGEAFAALAPDAADGARRVAQAIGESRIVCRMNWPSDVEAGERLGVALYAETATTPDFAADLAEARREVSEARAEGLTNPGCAFERRALRPDAG